MPEKNLMLQRYEDAQLHNYNENGLVIEEQIKLPGHSWNISDVKFNTNGLYLASAGWDKTTLVWDLKTLENPKVLRNGGHQDPITCLSWFPNVDTMLISGSSDKSMIIWNLDNVEEPMARLIEHEGWVLSITFEKEGKNMASSSWKGDVIIWDMNTITPKVQLNGHSEGVWCCAYNNTNSNMLCTASEDTSLRLWDLRNDNKWHSDVILSGLHTDGIRCCSWSPCGNYIAAGSRDSKVSIWDIRCNKAINCLYDHTNIVMETAFLTSSLLFTVGDTKCCVWNTFDPHGKSICSLQQHSWSYEVECLALSPDGTLLATGGVDKHITLSTIDLSDNYLQELMTSDNDNLKLPYAQIPAKTTSSMQEMKIKRSSAAVLDDAVYLNIAREKEDDERIARQTIRIKAPVTSELLQNKLNHLKTSTITTDNSQHKRENVANLFRRLSTRRVSSASLPTATTTITTNKMTDKNNNNDMENTKEVIVQSKHLVKNRTKKNGLPKTIPTNTTTAKRTKAVERPPQGSTTITTKSNNSILSELEGKLVHNQTPSITTNVSTTRNHHLEASSHSNNDNDCDSFHGDIDDVASEMIRMTEEEERKYAR